VAALVQAPLIERLLEAAAVGVGLQVDAVRAVVLGRDGWRIRWAELALGPLYRVPALPCLPSASLTSHVHFLLSFRMSLV